MKLVRDIIIPVLIALVIFAVFQTTLASFKVYGSSMMPSIKPGEYIMVSKAAYFLHPPARGDVVVFHSPRDPNSDLVKRIIALPGDTIEIKDCVVYVNGVPLSEPYTMQQPDYTCPRQEVPPDHYFVLGDNRNNSSDSHRGWTVPRANIVGRGWFTYWPVDEWQIMGHYSPISNSQMIRFHEIAFNNVVPCPAK